LALQLKVASSNLRCCLPPQPAAAMDEHRYNISMRFKSRGTEAYFVKSQSQQLLTNYFRLALMCVLTTAALLYLVATHPAAEPHPPGVDSSRRLAVASTLTCLVAAVLAGVATKMPQFSRCVSPEMREVLAVLVMMLLISMIFLVDLFYGPKLLGYDPKELWPDTNFSDTRPVLALSVLMTASHLTLPVRWMVLLPLEAFSVMVYAGFAFAIGGPDGPGAWSTLVLYIGLVLCSAIGRRTIESHQREVLTQLIRERSLRAETEFKLTMMEEQSQPPAPRHSQEDQLSTRESRPETTDSARVFVRAPEEGSFQRVIELGKHEQWLLDPKELDLLPEQVVGSGGFGTVYAGGYANTPVAIKMHHVSDEDGGSDGPLVAILNEIRVLRRLRHPRIVFFYGACLHSEWDDILLVLEWVHGPVLERFILEGGLPSRPLIMIDQFTAIMDTCRAVCYLHSRQPCVVHGDLKGTNIIMEWDPCRPDNFRAKLLDFGLACVLTRHAGGMGGTVMWIAPEVVQNPSLPAHSRTDVFSFGRLSFFILTGMFPFGACHERKAILEILKSGSVPPLAWPVMSSSLIAEWRCWIETCSATDPMVRPTLESVRLQISETVHKLGLEAATQFQGVMQPCQHDEADHGGADAARPSHTTLADLDFSTSAAFSGNLSAVQSL